MVILGDNILAEDLGDEVVAYQEQLRREGGGARVLLKEVPDPERYGVPRLEAGRIAEIIEKPSKPPSNYSVTGIYFYDPTVFDIIRALEPSRRGEYEISDVSNAYIQAGRMTHGVLSAWWGDAGTLEGRPETHDLARDLTKPALDEAGA